MEQFIGEVFGQELHAKRVLSLAGATLGAMRTCSLAVSVIGQGLALARGLETKHAVKQSTACCPTQASTSMPCCRTGSAMWWAAQAITVAMDWTEFAADGQATLMLSLLCRHGRATPLFWLTVETATLKDRRNGYEYQALVRLAEALPIGIKVCLVADRGFGDRKLYRLLTEELKFDSSSASAATSRLPPPTARPARSDWVGKGGRARVLRGATVTADGLPGPHRRLRAGQGHEGGLVPGQQHRPAAGQTHQALRPRWGIECGFSDTKDLRFGMGMGEIHVSSPARRDRLWLITAFTIAC